MEVAVEVEVEAQRRVVVVMARCGGGGGSSRCLQNMQGARGSFWGRDEAEKADALRTCSLVALVIAELRIVDRDERVWKFVTFVCKVF